ncbi:MAG: methylated-DNA--[protein]-cysteine S-methyltransferase [Candidatus Paracaedibacter sp.]|jgi:AraC family transcriptional regulator of adaptative response/methylated-DNA-[protein]-cysteine methyltransferase
MTKNKDLNTPKEEGSEDGDFDSFMEAVDNMDPEEARIMFQNIIAAMEEDGETVPFPMRLMTSDVLFGLTQTPVGLVYGIGGLGQLMLTGFISQEDIEELGDAETVLQTIMDDFEENISTATTVRDDEAIGGMIKSALDGTYTVLDDIFEAMEATDLQRTVWQELTKIPYGTTISYEELALRIGNPKAVSAIATAVGDNPLSIAVPCHRIIRKTGEVGDYHWGSDIKEKLLAYEQANK